MAIKDIISLGIGPSTSPGLTYFITFGLSMGAVADEWTPQSVGSATWTASSPTSADWTAQSPGSATWTPQ